MNPRPSVKPKPHPSQPAPHPPTLIIRPFAATFVNKTPPQLIADAVEEAAAALDRHPERRRDLAEQAVMRGALRQYPAFYLGHGPDDEAPCATPPTPPKQSPEERLLNSVRGITGPLEMLNPISPRLGLGRGTGTLPASFGIRLAAELGHTPTGERLIDDVLAEGMPDPETSGVIPEMREDIEAALALTPDWFEIAPPDMQGPFNIAHMVLGTEVFVLPLLEPDKFRDFMTLATDFYLALAANLRRWIGPRYPTFPACTCRIAECSLNMVSAELYREHVLPHDRRIAEAFGQVAIHPCSGPHVFRATLENLPVVYTEAGYIAKAYAGSIRVEEAVAEIGERPIILGIGQELPEGNEEEFFRRDLDLARANPRLLYGHTGMHWRKRDAEKIRRLHLRLDEYWARHVWA